MASVRPEENGTANHAEHVKDACALTGPAARGVHVQMDLLAQP